MKRHKNSLKVRILAFVMVLVLLVPFVSIFAPIIASAAEAVSESQNSLPKVRLEWGDGVVTDANGVADPYKSGAASDVGTYSMPFRIVVDGTVTNPIKLTVETFDLSATAGEDYAALSIIFELTEETKSLSEYNSGAVTVLYQRAPKIVDGNPMKDENGQYVTELDYVTRIQSTGELFTEQFGLRITNIENAKRETGKDTLRSLVLAEKNHVLNVVKNSSGVLYGCGDTVLQNFSDGYVYDGLGTSYTKENFKKYSKVEENRYAGVDIKVSEKQYFSVIDDALSNNPTLQRLHALYPDNMETWISAWINVDDDKNGERWGFHAYISEDTDDTYEKILYVEEHDKRDWNGQRFELQPNTIGVSDAAYSRNSSYKGLKFVPTIPDADYNFTAYNYEDVSGYKSNKTFVYSYSAIIVNRTSLVAESYSLENRAYGVGDTVYLTVKFNKPVQISGSEPLSIQAGIGESNKKYFDFVYCGGNMTDTLIFKTTLTEEGEGDYFGNYFKLLGFNNESQYTNGKGKGQIADMFWNKVNKNNTWTPSDDMLTVKVDGASVSINLPCTIDTRTPEIGNASSVPEKVQTSISFTTTISKIDANATVQVAWTESENAPAADRWATVACSVVGDKATLTLNQSGVNGTFYAHVKVISVSGAQAIRTFGPFRLDNLPPQFQLFSLDKSSPSNSATKKKVLGFTVWDQLNWEDDPELPFDKIYMKVTDIDTGENGLYSKLIDKTDGYYDGVSFDDDGNLLVYEKGKTNNILTLEPGSHKAFGRASIEISCIEESGKIKLINLDENPGEGVKAKEMGSYYIGFYVIDLLGNKSDITYSDSSLKPIYRFDTRDIFQLDVDYNQTYWYDGANNPTRSGAEAYFPPDTSFYWYDKTGGIQSVTWEDYNAALEDYNTYPQATLPDGTQILYKEDLTYYRGCIIETRHSSSIEYTGESYNVIKLSGDKLNESGTKPVYIKVNGKEQEYINAATNMGINKNAFNSEVCLTSFEIIDGESRRVRDYRLKKYADYYPEGGESLVHYSFGNLYIPESLEGYIEIQIETYQGEKVSSVLRFFILSKNSNSITDNYKSLYAEDRLMKNEAWQLSTSKFYSAENRSGVNYNPKGVTPIFSSKDIALEYAKFFEKQDIAIEYVDDEVEASKLESGMYSNFRKAEADKNVIAKTGQTWIRYKSIDWTLNSANEEQWVYYYYSDTKVTALDPQLTKNLITAIERNAKLICNYDGNNWIYLTANNVSKNYINKFGEPQYDSYGLLLETLKYRGLYNHDIICNADFSMYDSFINVSLAGYGGQGDARVPIVSNYVFTLDPNKGAYVEFCQYGSSTMTQIFDGDNLKDLVRSSGLYEIHEYSSGYRKYLVYVDVDAPVITYQLTVDKNNKTGFITDSISGGTLRASNFKVTGIVTSANGSLSVERDKWAYFYVTSATGIGSGKISAFMTAEELNAKGCELETGIYKLYSYDRLGNMVMQEIKVNTNELDIQHSIDNNGLTVNINREAKDVLSGSFRVYRDNVLQTNVSYKKSITFTRSGLYRIEITDIYGNSFSKEIAFYRELPSVSFSRQKKAGSGVYEPIELNSTNKNALSTVVTEDNQLFTISTAVNIRISYPSGTGYGFEFIGTAPTHATGGVTTKYIDINSTESNWVLKIFHETDPEVYIIITCIVDKDSPVISAQVQADEYEYNEFKGAKDNVLFTSTGATASTNFNNGELIVGDRAIISWSDETKVSYVRYSFNGGESKQIDAAVGSYQLTEAGKYLFEVTDMFGNVSTFEFTLVHKVDFTLEIGGAEQQIDYDPLKNIINGNEYSKTLYTSKETKLVVRENAMLALYYTNGDAKHVYNVEFVIEDGSATLVVGSAYNIEENDFDGYNLINAGEQPTGALFGTHVPVSYEYLNGILTLTIPKCAETYELFQIRVSDLNGLNPAVVQIERSGVSPEYEIFREDNSKLDLSYNGFIGSNQKLRLDVPSVSVNTTEIVSYYSESYTESFADAEKTVLFGDGANPHIEKEGYYKIVAVDKYGNESIVCIVVSFTLSIDVHIEYEQIKTRTQALNKPDTYSLFSNKSVSMVIWDERASVSCLKNGEAFVIGASKGNGCLEFALTEIGEYTVTVSDESGNFYTLNVSLKAPNTITYNGFITGFNENALKKDENYTNGALSLDKQKIEESGIKYVAFRRVGAADLTVLYDVVSLNKLDYSETTFIGSIGVEDGDYEVLFCDCYGNLYTETVRVSRKPMISIERQTQDITQGTAYDFDFALQNGAWSNYILTFTNTSENYVLKIDGEAASFTDGKYTFTLPANLGAAEEIYVLEYLDDYGNSYKINVHLYRSVPSTSLAEGADTVTSNGTLYSRGDFSMNWDGNIIATYSLDGTAAKIFDKNTVFTEDGKYTLVFTDYAGNSSTRVIIKDSTVFYDMISDGFALNNKAIVSGSVSISPDEELNFTATKDGELYSPQYRSFTEDGYYVITVTDSIGNVSIFEFTIYTKARQKFDLAAPEGYAFSQIWYIVDGHRASLVNDVVLSENGAQSFTFEMDGSYEIELLHIAGDTISTFALNIDNTPPKISLIGAENGGVTRENVTIEGLVDGDKIYVYKNGDHITTYTVNGNTHNVLELLGKSDFGNYSVIIVDEAGNSVSCEFIKEFATNVYANIFICILLVSLGAIGIIYIRYNGKVRTK